MPLDLSFSSASAIIAGSGRDASRARKARETLT
jgi:hypothetical protein